jgi:uridine phosphorylase
LAAGFLDELIAVGVTKFIVCGGCGVLNPEIAAGHPVILTSAVRDEGTSYHYLPPSREVKPHPKAVEVLESVFKQAGLEYRMGKTWTTDAIYRETPGKRKKRMEEGCDGNGSRSILCGRQVPRGGSRAGGLRRGSGHPRWLGW